MSDTSLEKIASLDDEALVLNEISGLIAKEREALRAGGAKFAPKSSGRTFPLLLNAGAVLFLLAVGSGLWFWYSAAQEAYVLQAATAATSGADIISALLKEAENSLAAKNKEIAGIESELTDIESQLSKLGLDKVVERKTLTDRRTQLQSNLAKALQDREALTAQVKTQTQNLEQAQGSAPSAADNALQDLMNQQELRKIYDQNLHSSLGTISDQLSKKKWDTAQSEIARLKQFVGEYALKVTDTDKTGAQAQASLLTSLETLVAAAKSGWPVDAGLPVAANTDDTKKLQDLIRQQVVQLQESNAQLKTQGDRLASLETLNQQAASQLDALLKSFNATLGTPMAGVSPGSSGNLTAATLESIPIRIQQLQAVAAKVQDFQVLVQKQTAEIETLKASGQSGSAQSAAQISSVINSFDALYRTFDPQLSTSSTVDTLPGRMADLQKLILQGQDSQGLLQKATDRIAQMQLDHDKLVAQLDKVAQIGKDYQVQATALRKAPASADRQQLRANIQSLVGVLKNGDTASSLFPDYAVYMNSLIESLIEVETARVKAMAQDELLAFMTTTQGKIADEQVRLLARASNAKEDTTALMTSLIKEIDQVTSSTLKDRNGKVIPKALGSVISVATPNVTVRKASRFETFKVKRVFISRILATGDRIPIAEAEIVATSGEDIILRITSTIAPTIYPERNDLVFVEM
ncbi:MAG: hypothetical protein WCG80_03635 [Spirochaetales bacterium]